jgi:NADH-quinone oxidoreductase subunit L
MWFLTFTGEPRDEHLHDHAHEPPRIMTTPLLILSVMALIGAGLPGFNALERFLEFGKPVALNTGMPGAVTHTAHELHGIATVVASLVAGIGILLAAGMYYWNMISAEEGRRHFPAIHALLVNKWYFDEIYRHLLVRPSLAIARAIAWTDRNVVDRTVETAASATYAAARTSGRLDINIVDGLVNQVAQVTGSLASALRTTQTGWLRGYVLYLAAGTAGLIALGATLYR